MGKERKQTIYTCKDGVHTLIQSHFYESQILVYINLNVSCGIQSMKVNPIT